MYKIFIAAVTVLIHIVSVVGGTGIEPVTSAL
jgi:hypothetical protein